MLWVFRILAQRSPGLPPLQKQFLANHQPSDCEKNYKDKRDK